MTAVVVLSVIGEMLTPNGRMKNSVRMVFALITTLVFISPLLSLGKYEFDFGKLFDESYMEADTAFAEYADGVREKLVEKTVKEYLEKKGVEGAAVDCEASASGGAVNIKNILINLSHSVITENGGHINNYELAKEVAELFKIDAGRVIVIE